MTSPGLNSLFRRAALFLSAVLLSSCNSPAPAGLQTGDYAGSLVTRANDGHLAEVAVLANVSQPQAGSWEVVLKSSTAQVKEATIVAQSGASLSLELSSSSLGASIAKNSKLTLQQDCFSASGDPSVRLCEDLSDLLIELRDAKGTLYSLTLHQVRAGTETPPEKPAVYTLDDAMKHAFTTSFESRAQFERAMEASHIATNAWWNLLPRLNINAGLTAAKSVTGGFLELVGTVGDFAPFLLPSRWFAAETASMHTGVEKMGLTLMRGDTGAQLESLIYSWSKDGDLLASYDVILTKSQQLASQIRSLEVFGLYPTGTADSIQTSVNQMKADQANISAAWDDQRAAIAQAMGFISPAAVTSVTLGAAPAQPDLDHLEEASFEEQVLRRSLELTQMDQLIQIAETSKTGTYFQWLDPSGDPNASLGAALPSSIQIAQDKVDQLTIARAQLEAVLRQKARQALDDYETAKSQAQLASDDLSLQQKREQRVLELVKFSKDNNLVELVGVYQDLLRSTVNERTAKAAIQVARVKLNRLLLEGYYSQLSF